MFLFFLKKLFLPSVCYYLEGKRAMPELWVSRKNKHTTTLPVVCAHTHTRISRDREKMCPVIHFLFFFFTCEFCVTAQRHSFLLVRLLSFPPSFISTFFSICMYYKGEGGKSFFNAKWNCGKNVVNVCTSLIWTNDTCTQFPQKMAAKRDIQQ